MLKAWKNISIIVLLQQDVATDLLLDENKYMKNLYTTNYLQNNN